MTDLRDPTALGNALLALASQGASKNVALSAIYDSRTIAVRDYDANPSVLEKYGDPRDLHVQRIADGRERLLS